MHIGLIPLDERPVNTRYPAMLAEIAGITLHQPPPALLSHQRQPADLGGLHAWLNDHARQLDALIVSGEMLGHGGLVNSRLSHESGATITARLDGLRALKQQHPSLHISGFTVITRIPAYDNAAEEPPYWADYGARLHQYSALEDRRLLGETVGPELEALKAEIPAEYRRDFLKRRLRNHTANLHSLHLLTEGIFDRLVISSDDTTPYGLSSREKRWIAGWAELLEPDDRLLMYPGADEIGCVLLARLVNAAQGRQPAFTPVYALPDSEDIIAPFEDGPLHHTVAQQIKAVGGQISADDPGAIWLGINPPVERRSQWSADATPEEQAERRPYLVEWLADLARRQAAGQRAALADVAYANGADPGLFQLLRDGDHLAGLTAYAGWNTANNTLGTVLAQAALAPLAATPAQHRAQETFLLHRYLEDWGYQHVVRTALQARLLADTGQTEPTPDQLPTLHPWIESELNRLIDTLPGFAGRYRVTPGSTTLPWQRTFEVDFALEPLTTEG